MAVIGLDATCLSVAGKGVSRYQHNLIKCLLKADRQNCYYVFLNKKNIIPEFPQQSNFHFVPVYLPNHIVWDQFQLPRILKKFKLDIYHTTSDTLPIQGKTKFLLYIFEIPDYRINLLSRGRPVPLYAKLSYKYDKLFFPRSLLMASIIMVSSHSTKNDLETNYNVDEKKIRVLYPGVDRQFCIGTDEDELLNTRKKYNAQEGYILHISSSDPRDNTAVVVRAYHQALFKLKVHKKLVIAGNVNPKVMDLDRLIKDLDLEKSIVFTGYREQKDLIALYQAADLYVDPSLYEGFGFQVAEALACGIPVIASNVTSLPEIVNAAGILVDPDDIKSLADAIIRVLTDSGFRQTMRQKGLERAKVFSWDTTAQETLSIYNELLCSEKLSF